MPASLLHWVVATTVPLLLVLLLSGCNSGQSCKNYQGNWGRESPSMTIDGCDDGRKRVFDCKEKAKGSFDCTCSEEGVAGKTFSATADPGQASPRFTDIATNDADRERVRQTVNQSCGWKL